MAETILHHQTKKAALYARVSTRDRGQDNENQLRELREFSDRQGWTIFAEYIDQESGAKSNRSEFQRMFQDASRRKFDVLLFWSLDRLSREGVLETLQHLNRLTSYGVGYRSFTEPYFDSCGVFKDAVISILATIAKQERIRLSERVRAGLDKARSRGKRLGRPRAAVDSARIANLRAQGIAWKRIASDLGVGVATIYRSAGRGSLQTGSVFDPTNSVRPNV